MTPFGNGAINRVNLHASIQAFAQGAGGAFVFVFPLRSGVPAPLVLCALAGMNLTRFALRGAVLPIARRIGLRETLVAGTVLEAAIFPLLTLVHGPELALVGVIFISAAGSVLYWTCYHAYFAGLGDEEARGQQVGVREALIAAIGIVAPALGAWAIVRLGPPAAFLAVAALQALAAAPLLAAPRVPIPRETDKPSRERRIAVTLLMADGWFGAGFFYLWQIALFVTLGERFGVFGGAMAFAGLFGAFGSLILGRMIDLGHGQRSVAIAYGFAAISVLLKAATFSHSGAAALANACGAVAASLVIPALWTRIYNLAKRSACPLRFHVATEGGWDLGCAAGCLAAAVMISQGAPFSSALLLALIGAAAAWVMLRRLVS